MQTPLHGCVLKLQRAEEHFHAAKDIVAAYTTSPFYESYGDFDYRGRLVARLGRVEQPPLGLSVVVGDCVQNFRAALDHLAYALAVGHTRPLPEGFARTSAFPIFRSGTKYRQAGARGARHKMRGMSRFARGAIQRLQPYHRDDQLRSLWMLEELANLDKHRLVHLTAAVGVRSQFAFGGPGFRRLDNIEVLPAPIREGAVVAHFHGEFDRKAGIEVQTNLQADVAFDPKSEAASVQGRSVMLVLLQIREAIVERVLLELSAELGRLYPGFQWTIGEEGEPTTLTLATGRRR